MAGGPRAREREGGNEAEEVVRADMMQAGAETMSYPQYAFFPISTVTESWVGACQLG